jgi:site-specific DNA-methyltransferase (cytosine-N4-specific)
MNPLTILQGDALTNLRTLPDESVQCCVTSPPYWGAQRDYAMLGQLGMEKTPEAFVESFLKVSIEIRRVLKSTGCFWLIIGDSYAASGKGGGGKMMLQRGHQWGHRKHLKGWRSPPAGYKQKDLVGVPSMVAFALRSQGWYFRSEVIWDKKTATEPTRDDRPCVSHEKVFLFSKSRRYEFDPSFLPHGTVWRVSTEGYSGHPAAYPPALIKPCILAGSKPGDVVLDPFGGSGTTGQVALELGRHAILIELNLEYIPLIKRRTNVTMGMF